MLKRLGILYPPCGAEFEYYQYGEALNSDVTISLLGVRIFGDDNEHAIQHLERTASINNLLLSGKLLEKLKPNAAVWACTSGSFIRGAQHAKEQIDALEQTLNCPVTSTSLAFIAALEYLNINEVAVLGTYPKETTETFISFLTEFDVNTHAMVHLDAPSGPIASMLADEVFIESAKNMHIPELGALLIPDTAVPSMHMINKLEELTGRAVLTANQVSLWDCARLANCLSPQVQLGKLFS